MGGESILEYTKEDSDRKGDVGNDYRFLYIGPQGSWTPLHCDVFGSYSWSANIVGRKRWLFWRPGKEPRDERGELVWRVGEEEHNDGRLEVEQEEGQVIFVPSGWHHQVTNLDDTVSINHNWFNGTNIEEVVVRLETELKKVQKELSDCKGDCWDQMCQQLLRDSYGMNLEDLMDLLAMVLERRVKMINQPDSFPISFDQSVLGYHHAEYDVAQIEKALDMLAIIFENTTLHEKQDQCHQMIEKCKLH